MGVELEAVKKNLGQQYAMADFLADHGEPETQAYLHNVAKAARQDISSIQHKFHFYFIFIVFIFIVFIFCIFFVFVYFFCVYFVYLFCKASFIFITDMFADLEYASRQAVIDPANTRLLAAVQSNADALKSACARLVENMSVATPNQV